MDIDYSKYSRLELLDSLENIDQEAYPERVKEIKAALKRPGLLAKTEGQYESSSLEEIEKEISECKTKGDIQAVERLEKHKEMKLKSIASDNYYYLVLSPLLAWLYIARGYGIDKTTAFSVLGGLACISGYFIFNKNKKKQD